MKLNVFVIKLKLKISSLSEFNRERNGIEFFFTRMAHLSFRKVGHCDTISHGDKQDCTATNAKDFIDAFVK